MKVPKKGVWGSCPLREGVAVLEIKGQILEMLGSYKTFYYPYEELTYVENSVLHSIDMKPRRSQPASKDNPAFSAINYRETNDEIEYSYRIERGVIWKDMDIITIKTDGRNHNKITISAEYDNGRVFIANNVTECDFERISGDEYAKYLEENKDSLKE